MNTIYLGLPFLAHFLIGFFYAFFGFWNIYHWRPSLDVMMNKGIPHAYFVLTIGIACQVLAGFMIIFGFFTKLAALVLIPFTIIAVLIFHPFWKMKGEHRALNMSIFIANLTMSLGALLLLIEPISQLSDLLSLK